VITLHARGDKRAAPHACMQTVIGSLTIAPKAVHSCELPAESAFQLSLAYTRNHFKSRKLYLCSSFNLPIFAQQP
jgi:hypothetical protein